MNEHLHCPTTIRMGGNLYLPAHFEEVDLAEILGLIADFPLATVVAQTETGLVADHIPLLLENDDRLIGHVALANQMHHVIDTSKPVLAIFRGEDSYVSPNWYSTKPQHHRHVPTWNYEVVHCDGMISFSHDIKAKRAVVGKMTRQFETRTHGSAGWRMGDAPADYMAAMIDNIVAMEIAITRVAGKAKMSQNREVIDAVHAAQMVTTGGRTRLGRRMLDAARRRQDR